jgi:hypothetical protein
LFRSWSYTTRLRDDFEEKQPLVDATWNWWKAPSTFPTDRAIEAATSSSVWRKTFLIKAKSPCDISLGGSQNSEHQGEISK